MMCYFFMCYVFFICEISQRQTRIWMYYVLCIMIYVLFFNVKYQTFKLRTGIAAGMETEDCDAKRHATVNQAARKIIL